MSHFLAQTDSALDHMLDDVRRRLGLDQHQQTDLLEKLVALASWAIMQAEAGDGIEAQDVLERLEKGWPAAHDEDPVR